LKFARQLGYAVVLLAALSAAAAALLAGRRFYQSLTTPRSIKPEAGATAWSLPAGSAGSVDRAPEEAPLPRAQAAALLHNPQPASPESVARGKEIYGTYCAMCHGAEGRGDGAMAAKLAVPPPDLTTSTARRSDGYLYATIRNGGVIMPSQGSRIDEQDRWAVVNFLRGIQAGPTAVEAPPELVTQSGGNGPAAPPSQISAAKPTAAAPVGDAARGRQVFDDHCSTCHDPDSNDEIVGPGLKNLFQWPAHKLSDGTARNQETATSVRQQITQGGGEMSAVGASFSEQEIADLIAYLKTL
jgi:mono/diheme cytochrome c family protein